MSDEESLIDELEKAYAELCRKMKRHSKLPVPMLKCFRCDWCDCEIEFRSFPPGTNLCQKCEDAREELRMEKEEIQKEKDARQKAIVNARQELAETSAWVSALMKSDGIHSPHWPSIIRLCRRSHRLLDLLDEVDESEEEAP